MCCVGTGDEVASWRKSRRESGDVGFILEILMSN